MWNGQIESVAFHSCVLRKRHKLANRRNRLHQIESSFLRFREHPAGNRENEMTSEDPNTLQNFDDHEEFRCLDDSKVLLKNPIQSPPFNRENWSRLLNFSVMADQGFDTIPRGRYVRGPGEVTEWPIVLVSKTSVLQGTGGSNPPLSASLTS